MSDDVEAIKQVKARYFRLMDTKQWDEMAEVFTEDCHVDTSSSGGGRAWRIKTLTLTRLRTDFTLPEPT